MPTCSDSTESASKAWNLTSQDSAQTNVRWETGSMEPTDSAGEGLYMPTCINLYETGLRRSPRLKENAANNGIKKKSHVTFGATLIKTVSLFTLLCNMKYSLPSMPTQHGSENFILTNKGDVNKFLRIEITQNEYSSYELS